MNEMELEGRDMSKCACDSLQKYGYSGLCGDCQRKALSAARKAEAKAVEALLLAARHTWDTIPAEHDGPMADAHAAALNNLKHAITDVDAARSEVRRLEVGHGPSVD